MTPFIQKLIERPCFTVSTESSVGDVVDVLFKHNIGAVVVVNAAGDVEGIISERDIVRRLGSVEDVRSLATSELMTRNVICISTNATSSELMKIMTEHKCRHVPILNEGQLAGMVSIGDVVKRLFEKLETEAEQMRIFINS